MSQDDERIKRLLELRELLKKRINKLENELIRLRQMLEALEETLLEQTLTTADKLERKKVEKGPKKLERVQLTSKGGNSLGIVEVDRAKGYLRFTPAEGLLVDAESKPIKSFLLKKMKEFEESSNARYELKVKDDGTLEYLEIEGLKSKELNDFLRMLRWAVERSLV